MEIINYTTFKKDMEKTFKEVAVKHEVKIITHQKYKSTVFMSLDDYNSLIETAYLLSQPKNLEILRNNLKKTK